MSTVIAGLVRLLQQLPAGSKHASKDVCNRGKVSAEITAINYVWWWAVSQVVGTDGQ